MNEDTDCRKDRGREEGGKEERKPKDERILIPGSHVIDSSPASTTIGHSARQSKAG